ncbi:GNAT family N-acetyltransferase [Fodinicola feengrottensis]|uniref:GNAT family N-acetyltransferase n=1 Tax=Fodinicola feengrottensis TaxID=435914 RepID=UPI0013D1E0F5|nr:GNAT family N-acetyltransferase [Fodinicola feengrottensis]
MGLLCRFCSVNKVVLVNNWLLSTNLYPALSAGQVAAVTAFLRSHFPHHAIGFCSVNNTLIQACVAAGCLLVPGRQIALARPCDHAGKLRRRWRRDLLLVDRRGYRIGEPGPAEVPRLVELYNNLYLDKYSSNNPQFNEHFVRETLARGTITYITLTRDDRIDGVLGYFVRDGVMTTPIFGYDTALPQQTGLYRMLGGILYDLAAQKGWLLNDSSGAAEFKRLRGAVPELEYRAVHVRHLRWRQRFGWVTLCFLFSKIAVPLARRYEL